MGHIPADNIFGLQATNFSNLTDTFIYAGVKSTEGGIAHVGHKLRVYSYTGEAYITSNLGPDVGGNSDTGYVVIASPVPFYYPEMENYEWNRNLLRYERAADKIWYIYGDPWWDTFTYDGKTVYYKSLDSINVKTSTSFTSIGRPWATDPGGTIQLSHGGEYAWLMVYGGYSGFTVNYDLVNCVGSPNNPQTIQPNEAIINFDFEPDTTNGTYAFNSGSAWVDGDGYPPGTPITMVFEPETGHLKITAVSSEITVHVHAYGDPYQNVDGESDIPGGSSVPVPTVPPLTATTSGVIGLFAPTVAQMNSLADFMWTDFGGTGTTVEDILAEVVQALKRSISNPLDYVVGLNIIPSQGLSIGASSVVRFGFVSSGVSMPRLTNQYFTVDCGSLSFNTLCGDTFLDYAPYSKFSIYLPYIGVKDVDANDFVGHTISVMYRGDVVTGGVTAYILKDGSVMYQYSGCCALNIPLTADSWGSTIAAAVQIATSVVAGGISGGAAGVASSAVKGAASVAANPSLLSPQVMRSGAVSGGAGCMGVQKPFVIREAVRFHSTSGFNTVSGYPSYYYKKLSSMHGFTVCYDVHLVNIPATKDELREIENLLKEGVIF